MKQASLKTLTVLLATLAYGIGNALAADQGTTLGWVEQVAIQDTSLVMDAKIDTGADNSSINASDIGYFTRGGETWVRFNLRDRMGAHVTLERPLLRLGQIKRKQGGHIERPVVTLAFCVAGQMVDAEVNLAKRDHFKYQLLVGRSLMANRFLVDPVRTHITRPACAAT
jgi:hypothetical protein